LALGAYTFLDAFWTILVFFVWIAWFMLLFRVFGDLFRRHDASGWVKAAWVIFVIILPFLGVLIYLIINSGGIAERDMNAARAAKADMDSYVQSVAGSGGAAAEIAKAKELLDSGAISQEEYERLKQRAMS
jgi:putative oligomerization/nucleic acid binding protein/phospholipase D-like protein